jgi:PLP dependent protein
VAQVQERPTHCGSNIEERLRRVQDRIAAAAGRAGRDHSRVRLMVVSKFRSDDEIAEAYRAGARLFGESRVQEGARKAAALFSSLPGSECHLIGHLQSNKAKEAITSFSCVQSMDSVRLAGILLKESAAAGKRLDVFLEAHTGEESKAGFREADELWRTLDLIRNDARGSLIPQGLMTMAPFTADQPALRSSFRKLSALGREWAARYPESPAPLLSMGMSNDFEIAIEEGSDLVRVGTAIFGEAA